MESILKSHYNILFTEQKKSAQKVWSKDLVHEKTFRLSSHTPHHIL